jgi:hypothetical protein
MQAVSVAGSTAVIATVLANVPMVWTIVSAAAALSTTLAPLFLLSEKVVRFEKLHFAYAELLADFKQHIRDITLTGSLGEEHRAVSEMLFERYARLAPLDEVHPDERLKDALTDVMERAIPVESLWMPEE